MGCVRNLGVLVPCVAKIKGKGQEFFGIKLGYKSRIGERTRARGSII